MHKILSYFIRSPSPSQQYSTVPVQSSGPNSYAPQVEVPRQNYQGYSNNYWYENNYDKGLCIKFYILLGHHNHYIKLIIIILTMINTNIDTKVQPTRSNIETNDNNDAIIMNHFTINIIN